MKLKYKFFCIDFDGTIAYDAYPKIGRLIPGAKETMLKIKELGGKICIWTCRTGEHEDLVKDFLEENGIPYDKLNQSFDEHIAEYGSDSRKVFADIYIDDRSLHFQKQSVEWDIVEGIIFTYDEWRKGDTIECQQDCYGNFKTGERFEITSIDMEDDYVAFGPVGTSLRSAQIFFKKVG